MIRIGLFAILLMASALSVTGIGWGLPSQKTDRYLFGNASPWTGRRLVDLKGGDWDRRPALGSDVDPDPIRGRDRLVELTATDAARAEILIRYRLYSHQPDEVLTLRALASMKPRRFQMDPKLYQYGGLFVYPVGALIGLCSAADVIDVRGDLADCLDHPSAFGKLYVVVRAYAAAFGLVGVVACFLLGRRLGGPGVGLFSAFLFVLLPVVITMSHEGKPHLPGAVLMLLAGLVAMRYVETGRTLHWRTTAILCGLTWGMVLSGWPALAALAVAAWQRPLERGSRPALLAKGVLVAVLVFLLVNPYLVINAVCNRDVLRSNLGTSTGMYEIGRLAEGFGRVAALLMEGAGPIVAVVGTLAIVILLCARRWALLPVLVPAGLVVIQFSLIGAGKPGEYGRFLIVPATLLAVLAAWAAAATFRRNRCAGFLLAILLVVGTGLDGYRYLRGFVKDADQSGSRYAAADFLAAELSRRPKATVGLIREPAPYAAPPIDVVGRPLVLLPRSAPKDVPSWPDYVVVATDRPDDLASAWWRPRYQLRAVFPSDVNRWLHRPTVISWADKPVVVFILKDPPGATGGSPRRVPLAARPPVFSTPGATGGSSASVRRAGPPLRQPPAYDRNDLTGVVRRVDAPQRLR